MNLQIDKLLKDYEPFNIEDYIDNPVALARIKANLTQAELAERMNVTQAYISKLESQSTVSAKVMAKVTGALHSHNIDVEWLDSNLLDDWNNNE